MELFGLTYFDKDYRKSRVSMQTRHTNGGPSDIPVQKAKE